MTSLASSPVAPMRSESPVEPVVQTFGLSKSYRTGFWLNKVVTPLKQCSLAVYPGQTFGLLGPNGAGKTTLLKTLLGIIRPSSGRGFVLGESLGDRSVKQRLGYLPENPYFYDYLTGWEFLDFTAGLFQIPAAIKRKRIPELLDLVGLDQGAAKKKQMRRYSKGMLQRVGMAQALINDPELIFLDEPMSGLDPLGRYQMREIIVSLKSQGKTVFFNSHVLSDVELICDRVAILAQGEIICQGTIDELLGTETEIYQVRGRGGEAHLLRQLIPNLEVQAEYWNGEYRGEPERLLQAMHQHHAQLLKMDLVRPSLEEFFIQQLRERGLKTSS
jgi:ABC-2 type transport system ATP-binding protein